MIRCKISKQVKAIGRMFEFKLPLKLCSTTRHPNASCVDELLVEGQHNVFPMQAYISPNIIDLFGQANQNLVY